MIDQLINDITAGAWAMTAEAIYGRLPLMMNILQQTGKPEGADWGKAREANLPYQVECNTLSASPNNTANLSEDQPKKIMVIPIHGVITKYDQYSGEYGMRSKARFLEEAYQNKEISGIVLDMDSGGGAANAPKILADVIQQKKKPVVTFVNGVSASAAYWVAAATDQIIVSQNTDILGSIGTMFSFLNIIPKLEKEGYEFKEVYSKLSGQKNHFLRDLLKGGENAEEALQNEILIPLTQEFIGAVKSYRGNKINPDFEKAIFEGKTYMAKDAIKAGLADQMGSMQQAIQSAATLSENYFNSTYNTMSKNYSFINKLFPNMKSQEEKDEELETLESALAERDAFQAQLMAKTTEVETLTSSLKSKANELQVATQKASHLETEVATLKTENTNLKAQLDADPETVSIADSVEKGEQDVSSASKEKPLWEQTEWAAEAETAKATAKNPKVEL